MKKFIGSVLATTLILGGCSTMENESKRNTKTETKSVPEEMEASKYVGQGFDDLQKKMRLNLRRSIKIKLPNEANNFLWITSV